MLGSRHSSYTSHASRMSYTSHGDLLGGIGSNGKVMTKESQLRCRSLRNGPTPANNIVEYTPRSHRGDYVGFHIDAKNLIFMLYFFRMVQLVLCAKKN